jgi:hypothetical protein
VAGLCAPLPTLQFCTTGVTDQLADRCSMA